jgi:hypothetical protein
VNSSMEVTLYGSVTHIACTYPYDTGDPSDYFSKVTLPVNGVDNDQETATVDITTESSKYDLWVFDLKWNDIGGLIGTFQGTIQCGFEGVDSGGTVQLVVDGPSSDVTVKFPSALSSNCSKSWAF